MRRVINGIYKNGKIILDDPVSTIEESKITIIFLENKVQKLKLTDIFSIYGPWEDTRTVENIINDIRNY